VLMTGGKDGTASVATAELYDPDTDAFEPAGGTLSTARYYHTATLLPSGSVLVVGGWLVGMGHLASAELYDPVTRTFAPTPTPPTGYRHLNTATLLLSGEVLLAGNGFPSAEIYNEGRGAQPAWTPAVAAPPPPLTPGGEVSLQGTLFTGVSEASSGGPQSSPTDYPLVLLRREDNEAMTYAAVTAWSATEATVTVPSSVASGPFLLWVVANGVLSTGRSLVIQLPNGSPCALAPDCSSGFCVDGTCCADACSTPCMSCANAAGTCTTFIAAGQPDLSSLPPCVAPNACDGAGNCVAPQADAGVDVGVDAEPQTDASGDDGPASLDAVLDSPSQSDAIADAGRDSTQADAQDDSSAGMDAGADGQADAQTPADAFPDGAVPDDSGQGADTGPTDAGRDSAQGRPGISIATCGGCATSAGHDGPRQALALLLLWLVALPRNRRK